MTSDTAAAPPRWRADLPPALALAAGSVLLGAPAGLLWSHLSPRLRVTFGADGPTAAGIESTKAFIGADGSYVLVMLGAGLLCGLLAWLLVRRSGPWAVLALALGGFAGAVVAARVGVLPGSDEVVMALRHGKTGHAPVDLYLGKLHGDSPQLRSTWAAVAWPVGALLAFLIGALRRPEELD
ncbi:MAG TPA: hypothetical protein VMZ11_09660 [Mycobacteriales bacterium]|nr:hypothetical protein [Mycobacteriales bacterium]